MTTFISRKQSFLFLVFVLCFYVAGQIAARLGAGPFIASWQVNIWIIISYACLGIRGFLWALSLRNIPLSVAYPLLSINYLLILGAAALIFKEPVSTGNIIGSFLIISGLICFAFGEKNRGS